MPDPITYDHSDASDKTIETVGMIDDTHQLSIKTRKSNGGSLMTTATVSTIDGDFRKHRIYVDFYRTLESNKTRVTGKALRDQHSKHDWTTIHALALAYYAVVSV